MVMFPFGPHSPGGDGAAGAEEPPPLGGPAATSRPPSPASRPEPPQQGADAAPPPPGAGSPRLRGRPALSPDERAGELATPRALELSAAASQAKLSPSSSPRRRSRPDCRADSRSRQGHSAGLGGPGARLFGWLRDRSLGRGLFVDPARDNFRTMTNLYGSIHPADSVYLSTRTHGAVFNLEYSPDG